MSSFTVSLPGIDHKQERKDDSEYVAAAEEQMQPERQEEAAAGSSLNAKGAVAFGVVLLAGLLVWNSLADTKEATVVQPAKTNPSQHHNAGTPKSKVSSAVRAGVFAKAVQAAGCNRAAVGIAAGAALLLVAALVYWQMSKKVVDPIEYVDDDPVKNVVDPPKNVVDHDQELQSDLGAASLAFGGVCLLAIIGFTIYCVNMSLFSKQPNKDSIGDEALHSANFPLKELVDDKTFFESSLNVVKSKDDKKALQMRAQYLFKLLIDSELATIDSGTKEFSVIVTDTNSRLKLEMSEKPGLFEILVHLKNYEKYIPLRKSNGCYYENDEIHVVSSITSINDEAQLNTLISDISAILENKKYITYSHDKRVWIEAESITNDNLLFELSDLVQHLKAVCKWNEDGEDVEVKIINADSKSDENAETVKLPQGSNIYDLYRKLYSEKSDAQFALIFDKQRLRWSSNQLVTGVTIYKKDLSYLSVKDSGISDDDMPIMRLCYFSLKKAKFYLQNTLIE